jgi:hypothetical protein
VRFCSVWQIDTGAEVARFIAMCPWPHNGSSQTAHLFSFSQLHPPMQRRKTCENLRPAFAAACNPMLREAGMGDNDIRRCPQCGGPVDLDGHTLIRVARPLPTRHLRASPAAPPDDDPAWTMTPNERFARAIERRDALLRDRRTAGARGRRSTDTVLEDTDT